MAIKIPKKSKLQTIKEHIGKDNVDTYRRFDNFHNGVLNNQFMRDYLLKEQDYMCPFCDKEIKKTDITNIHHEETDIQCCYVSEIPPCEKCFYKNHMNFYKCYKALKLLHRECHIGGLHGYDKKRPKEDEEV